MTAKATRRAMQRQTLISWRGVGRRLRLVRSIFKPSEEEAAAVHGVTLGTYRHFEAGKEQNDTEPALRFCEQFDIPIEWYIQGVTHSLGHHLTVNRGGKISILPAMTRHERQQIKKFGSPIGRHASERLRGLTR
jgi:DNA-binding XRE family transcriptional regulator